jgi:hypothetical protein
MYLLNKMNTDNPPCLHIQQLNGSLNHHRPMQKYSWLSDRSWTKMQLILRELTQADS